MSEPTAKRSLDHESGSEDEPDQKRRRTDAFLLLKNATLEQLIGQVNSRVNARTRYFICDECNLLCTGGATYLDTSKWGYERPFCQQCRLYCRACKEYYAPPMSYMHEDCDDGDSDEEDEEENE
jgi:hypothetical protein